MSKRITEEELKERLRPTGILLIGPLLGMHKRTKFLDPEYGEFFSRPVNVLAGCRHPEGKNARRRKTVEERFGSFSELGKKNIEKGKEVSREKYGTDYYMQTREFKDKSVQAMGVSNAALLEETREKKRRTVLDRYGVEYSVLIPKASESLKKKYETEGGWTKTRYRTHDGFPMFSEDQHPSFNLCAHYSRKNNITIEEAYEHLKDLPKNQTSLEYFTSSNFSGLEIFNKKHPVLPFKPDFRLSTALWMNVDGHFFHREDKKGRRYHYAMRELFEKQGEQILQFTEFEIFQKTEIVESIIASKRKTCSKIMARKCKIEKTTPASLRNFLEENHLKGYTVSQGMGLFLQDRLVAVLSYKIIGQTLKIERFCTIKNYTVVGGYSRLLKAAINETGLKIVETWVDLRYGTGKSLEKLGFRKQRDVLGWFWADQRKTYNRLFCRANMDDRKLTEREYANELKIWKIFDAGQRLFRLEIS